MCKNVLRPHQVLVGVRYFTARVGSPVASQARQSIYIDTLSEATVAKSIFGRLQLNDITCRACRAVTKKPEEKKTDVAIASHMIADAYEGRYDAALLVSGDSDLAPPVEIVKAIPGRRVIAVFPPRRKSSELARVAGASFNLSENTLRQSQLPATIALRGGTKLLRPPTWR
jgi:uncharacterized LabA/DUF88 family protein